MVEEVVKSLAPSPSLLWVDNLLAKEALGDCMMNRCMRKWQHKSKQTLSERTATFLRFRNVQEKV